MPVRKGRRLLACRSSHGFEQSMERSKKRTRTRSPPSCTWTWTRSSSPWSCSNGRNCAENRWWSEESRISAESFPQRATKRENMGFIPRCRFERQASSARTRFSWMAITKSMESGVTVSLPCSENSLPSLKWFRLTKRTWILSEPRGGMDHFSRTSTDSVEFVIDAEPKSISNNHTFGEDTSDSNVMASLLSHLSQKACKRLREAGLAARTLTLTIRYAGFETHTRSKSLAEPTRLDSDIYRVFHQLFRTHRDPKRKVRLLGVSLSGLTHGNEQLDLLEAERRARLEKLTSAADRLRDRFGFGKVQFGGSLGSEGPEQSHDE